jgi:Tfp pilus assembly protein PilO
MLIDLYSKSTASSRMALIATIAAIGTIGSYNWFIAPHIDSLKAAQRYVGQIGTFPQKSKILEGKLKIKKLEINKLSKQIAEVEEQFFTPADAQQFLSGFEFLAKQANCAITSLNQLPEENHASQDCNFVTAGIATHRVSVSLAGRYPDIVKFVKHISGRPHKVLINPFSISVRQGDSDKVECSMILTIYVAKDLNFKGVDPNE